MYVALSTSSPAIGVVCLCVVHGRDGDMCLLGKRTRTSNPCHHMNNPRCVSAGASILTRARARATATTTASMDEHNDIFNLRTWLIVSYVSRLTRMWGITGLPLDRPQNFLPKSCLMIDQSQTCPRSAWSERRSLSTTVAAIQVELTRLHFHSCA